MAHIPPSASVQRQGVATISNAGSHQYQYTQVNGGTNLQGDNYGQINLQASHFHHNDYGSRKSEFLRSLDPGVTTARYNRITDTKYDTFEWAFNEEESKPRAGPNFPGWLRGPMDTFLVSGKAGSGKSTFMKFLAKHPKTLCGLSEWAASSHVVILFHGFWASGTKHEHSMKGLLASCIYQFVTLLPDALEQSNLLSASALKYSIDHWSPDELHDVFFGLLERSSTCCCLFLDGLDEFDHQDDDDRLFGFIAEVRSRTRTKVCLSSRPIPHILKRLTKSPVIKLQDLTWDDMYKHVWNTLQEKSDITGQDEMAGQLGSLAYEMCKKADGVFLWVHYALHNVCKGLKVADEIPDLRKRIDELPSEVVEMYKAMWQKNNRDHPVHAKQAAKILSLHKDFPMPFFQLAALVDPTLANHYSINQDSIGGNILDHICNKFLLRLPTLSAGLLECRMVQAFTASRATHSRRELVPNTELRQSEGTWRRMEVRLIHRTVADFLADKASSGALLSDVHCGHITMRDYMQSLLACFFHGVFELTLNNIAVVCSTLSSVRNEEAYIVDQIDASCSELVRAQYPTLISSTSNWVQSLVEEVVAAEYRLPLSYLDFPSLLTSCSASGSCIMHMLNTSGSAWTPYYKGWLALCLVGDALLDRNSSHHWTIIVQSFTCLAAHGADITTPQTIGPLWNIRSPVLLLLGQLVARILNGHTIKEDALQALLSLVRELNLESQLVTICVDMFAKAEHQYFYAQMYPWGATAEYTLHLISFVATDLVEMLVAAVIKRASNWPETSRQGCYGDPIKNGSLLQIQYRAYCRTIARDVGRVVSLADSEYFVALLCSSASMRSQILDAIFLPCTNSVSLPVIDGPVWEVPDIDLTIPFWYEDHDFKRLPVDPYTEVSPHEWKQHCTIRDYYAREAQIRSIRDPQRRAEVYRWREARPLWSQSRAVYDYDFDFDFNFDFDSHSEVISNSDSDYDPPGDARPKPKCVFPP